MSNENDDLLPDDDMMNMEPIDDGNDSDDPFAQPAEESLEGAESSDESAQTDENAVADGEEAPEESSEEPEFQGNEGDAEDVEETKEIVYRPPHMDLYTVLLVLALIFVSLAATLHYLEVPASEYGNVPFKKGSPRVTAPANP